MRKEILADGIELYLGDCRDVIPTLSRMDSLITDPPYGVGFTGKVRKLNSENRKTYDDSDDNFIKVILPAVKSALALTTCAAIFTGVRKLQEYPMARDIGGIICPAGTGCSPWGFGCYNPVLFYGPSPHRKEAVSLPTAIVLHGSPEKGIEHPCSKPLSFMNWTVEIASLCGQVVFDPFCGSGTTGVACVEKGRRFVGIELDPHYFDVACRRIDAALSQVEMFVEKPKRLRQVKLFTKRRR